MTLHCGTLAALGVCAALSCAADEVKWLDEMDLGAMSCGMAKTAQARKSVLGKPLRLGDKTYERGVGTHSESVIVLRSDGRVKAFDAVVGVDRETQEYPPSWRTGKNWGSCSFRIYADGKKVCDSGVIKEKDAPKTIHADLAGAKWILLECTDGGHWAGYLCGHGDWADARFTCADEASLTPSRNDPLVAQLGVLTPPESPAPSINGAAVWGVRPGHEILYRIPVSGARPMTVSVQGKGGKLPDGLVFDADRRILSGRIAQPGNYDLVITAHNASGEVRRDFTLKVGEKITLTPPMGWNSWNIYASAVTDELVRKTARGMHESGLAEHGWSYVNIDDWWMKNKGAGGKGNPNHDGPARDAQGRMIPQAKFPDMKALADYVHSLGLKLGIYSSPGATTCGGCEGSLGHEAIDARTWAEWGIDYLKHDWCSYGGVFNEATKGRKPTVDDYAKPYRLMTKCLREQSRDIVHAFCQYGMGDVQSWGEDAGAQVWRSWGDLKDNWTCVLNATESYADAWKFTRPGFWCDPDMMVLGYLNTDFGMHDSFLSRNEQYTHMSLWCLLNAPLLLGCDLNHIDDFTRNLLVNDEIIAVNQDAMGRQARRVYHDDGTDIWLRPMSDGTYVAGIVNRLPFAERKTFAFASAGLAGSFVLRDLWRRCDLGTFKDAWSVEVPGHATTVVRLSRAVGTPAPSLEEKIAVRCKITGVDQWYGFRRINFDFNGRAASLVAPSVPAAAGTPWTWTIQWWSAFVDRTGVLDLLGRGWHHVWIDCFNDRGNEKAIADFAAFQSFLVDELGFAEKTCLVGMSWGGFFSTRYAAAHPQNVAKIYLDAPLLNLSSLNGRAATAEADSKRIGPWAFEAPADGDWSKDVRMPVNLAAKIAAAKIPVLLLYGGQDHTVDPKTSSELFAERFKAAGGNLTCERRGLFGHHPHGVDPNKTAIITNFFAK